MGASTCKGEGMKRDPYDVLGIPRASTFSEARAAYFRLAKKHHPDKLVGVTEEERRAHEEIFKDISAAYETVERRHEGHVGDDDNSDWRAVWSKVEGFFQSPELWACMSQILQEAARKKEEEKHAASRIHTVYLPITLEELHLGKKKKVQLFLHNVAGPLVVRVSCKEYPCARVSCVVPDDATAHTVKVHMRIQDHCTYRFDDLLGRWDLYTEIAITWSEYITGTQIRLPWLDGGVVEHDVPPMPRLDVPVVIPNSGIACKGDLYVALALRHPTQAQWDKLTENDKKTFMRITDALSA